MAAEDDLHFMYILNFNDCYIEILLVFIQARYYLKPFRHETTADVDHAT